LIFFLLKSFLFFLSYVIVNELKLKKYRSVEQSNTFSAIAKEVLRNMLILLIKLHVHPDSQHLNAVPYLISYLR